MVFPQILHIKFFPNSLGVDIIFMANSYHIKIAIESFLGRELSFFEIIPTSHILIQINYFPYE